MKPTKRNTDLSRRKLLGGLGAIGVASAGAGLGTTAFFSDSESFEENTITAGQFELNVTQSTQLVDQDGIGPDEQTFDAVAAGDETIEINDGFLDITDAKPGDVYQYCWDICVKHNPGYVQITLDSEESTGDELGVDHTDASGLLSDYMRAIVRIDDQRDDDPFSDSPRAIDLQNIVFNGTLGELVDEFADGGLVHAMDDGETVEYCHLPCETSVAGAETSPDPEGVQICVLLYLPENTTPIPRLDFLFGPITQEDVPGNLVQGASFEADVHFAAEQCRHNDDPFSDVPDADPPIHVVLNEMDATVREFDISTDGRIGSGAWQSVGSEKELLYVGPDFTDFDTLAPFAVDEIAEISYWTKKDGGPSDVDFYLLIYTETGTGNDDASWYGKRLNAEPYYLSLAGDQITAPADEWNEWSTAGTVDTDPLRFVDENRDGIGLGYADGTMPTLQDLQAGPTDWSKLRSGGESTSIDYGAQTVKTIAISTGTPWNTGFDGLLDEVRVSLVDGSELLIDLEP